MAILDFKEIAEAHKGGGQQDTFEAFAEEFFDHLGYSILRSPSRGADGGKDLIVQEERSGRVGTTKIKYLVSCKHKAHSGNSVSPSDEPDIKDRVTANGCDAFLGFYSTVASSGLDQKLNTIGFESHIFTPRKIERVLLKSKEGLEIARRYFPLSTANWERENPVPVDLFNPPVGLRCEICNRDLLESLSSKYLGAIVGFCIPLSDAEAKAESTTDEKEPEIVDIRFYCKDSCVERMERRLKREGLWEDGWEDVHEFMNPVGFIHYLTETLLRQDQMNTKATRKFVNFLRTTFPYVSRQLTSSEQAGLELLNELGLRRA